MGGSKYARFLVSGCYSEVCPLFFIWVVADDRNDFAFLVNDGNACLKLGNGSVIAMKGNETAFSFVHANGGTPTLARSGWVSS